MCIFSHTHHFIILCVTLEKVIFFSLVLRVFFFFFFFFVSCFFVFWKFSGQRSNLRYSSDNAESLTTKATGELPVFGSQLSKTIEMILLILCYSELFEFLSSFSGDYDSNMMEKIAFINLIHRKCSGCCN